MSRLQYWGEEGRIEDPECIVSSVILYDPSLLIPTVIGHVLNRVIMVGLVCVCVCVCGGGGSTQQMLRNHRDHFLSLMMLQYMDETDRKSVV